MITRLFHAHKLKLAVGAPILFLVLITSSGVLGVGNILTLSSRDGKFTSLSDEIVITLGVSSKVPVNAVGATLFFDKEVLQVVNVSRVSSVIDLWSEEPVVTNSEGSLAFSGGLIGKKANTPITGDIMTVTFKPIRAGTARIEWRNGEMLAHNGEGTNVYSGGNTLRIYVRDPNAPSPDINGDGALSMMDVNHLYFKTFGGYDARYDLNQDGKLNFSDVRYLTSLF